MSDELLVVVGEVLVFDRMPIGRIAPGLNASDHQKLLDFLDFAHEKGDGAFDAGDIDTLKSDLLGLFNEENANLVSKKELEKAFEDWLAGR